jgi:small subunit ribosomal protein S1
MSQQPTPPSDDLATVFHPGATASPEPRGAAPRIESNAPESPMQASAGHEPDAPHESSPSDLGDAVPVEPSGSSDGTPDPSETIESAATLPSSDEEVHESIAETPNDPVSAASNDGDLAATQKPAPDETSADEPETGKSTEPFSQLLEARSPSDTATLTVGQRVRGKILSIGDEQVIVSLSGRPDAVLESHELRGPDGTMLLRVDDPVSAIVQSVEVPLILTLGKKRGLLNAAKLRIAHEEKRPVTGTVRAVNKGGFEVRVQGLRGFCPSSQIDFGMMLDPQTYVGQTYTFRVLRWENGGRNIVLSRRAILKIEAEERAVETRAKLAVGSEFEGIVKRVQPFGAFVDIGGVEGLLHVSRMGHGNVKDPTEVVVPGQPVHVRVTRVDNSGTGKERIALAAPDLGPDPWETARETLHEGDVVHGRVVRLADFGVFVKLAPGIDGLVHVSELPRPAGSAEAPPVQPGEDVEVRILKIDFEKKRVSLSMRPAASAERAPARESRRPRRERDRDRDRGRDREPAPHPTGGSLTHTMAEQLGALRRKLQVRP